MTESSHDKYHISRRSMLKTILYTSPMLMFSPASLLADEKIKPLYPAKLVPKGKKIRVAQIGVFNRGRGVMGSFNGYRDKQFVYTAFADVDFKEHDYRLSGYPDVPCFNDYREMLEAMHDKIDAVIICTPDHAHFPMTIHSMLLGKHVYVEKPLAQNVYECRLLEKVAKDCGVVTQMGNQGHSGGGTKQFAKLVEEGCLDKITKIDAWMNGARRWHGWTIKDYPEQTPPAGFDWDIWLGRRPFRPYSDKMVGGNWRCWFEFGCGALGDWGAHILDAIHRYLKLPQPYEITTKLIGPNDLYYPQGSTITFKFKMPKGNTLEINWYDGQGNSPKAPAGFKGKLPGAGSLTYLKDGALLGYSHGKKYDFVMNDKLEKQDRDGTLPQPPKGLSSHAQNFLNACQGIEPANSSFDVSAPLSEMLCLGCIAQKYGGTLKYDAKRMKITNNTEANKMLNGPDVRDGWTGYDKGKPIKSKAARIKSPDEVQWEELFTDSKLSKWENPYEWGTFEFKDGVVSLDTDRSKWFLLTKKEYANFIFEAEIKMPVKQGNSGFLVRCLKSKNRAWGYQAEVDTADRKWSGGFYDEGRRMWFISPNRDKAESKEAADKSIAEFRARAGECFKQGEWNKYKIVCIGQHIQFYVNGTLTTDVYDGVDVSGYIGIQHHGEKGLKYQFRNLRVKDLGAGGEVYYPHLKEIVKPVKPVASKLKGDVYEAEEAKMTTTNKATNQAGFQGKGFADYGNDGSAVEWSNVKADSNGDYILTFRYASGGDRPCKLLVNGKDVGKLNFKNTPSWTSWKTETVKVKLNKGANSVKVVSIKAGPNLDAMAVTK